MSEQVEKRTISFRVGLVIVVNLFIFGFLRLLQTGRATSRQLFIWTLDLVSAQASRLNRADRRTHGR
jgi:hypothetical protein